MLVETKHVFMDNQNYEQIALSAEQIAHELKFLKENMEVQDDFVRR